jgi:hypothetical protein
MVELHLGQFDRMRAAADVDRTAIADIVLQFVATLQHQLFEADTARLAVDVDDAARRATRTADHRTRKRTNELATRRADEAHVLAADVQVLEVGLIALDADGGGVRGIARRGIDGGLDGGELRHAVATGRGADEIHGLGRLCGWRQGTQREP